VSRRFSLFWVTVLAALFVSSNAATVSAQARRAQGGYRAGPAVPRTSYYRPYYRSYYHYPYYRYPYYYAPFYASFWYPYPYFYAPYGFYGGYYGGPYGFYGAYYGGGYYDPLASVRVEVRPREARVYVDGYFAGEVDSYDGTFQRLRVSPGAHQIEVYLEGYKTLRQTMYLAPDSTFKLRGELEKLGEGQPPDPVPTPKATPNRGGNAYGPPSARRRPMPEPPSDDPTAHEPAVQGPREAGTRDSEFGTIAVKFQPADAEVLIDGELWQGADQDRRLLVSLPAGPHRVEVRKPGHKSFSTDVDVTPGETTTVNVSLSKDGRP
jgi:hypothetical protein